LAANFNKPSHFDWAVVFYEMAEFQHFITLLSFKLMMCSVFLSESYWYW
jgi:hypothetical protein